MAATLTADQELTWTSFPIEKVESTPDGNLMVWGKATDGSVDSDEQIVDPDFAAKGIAEWLETGPNVRVQHQAQRDPAGVGISMEKDGDAHWVKSLVVEPVAQRLVKAGALRAYSVGIARPTIVRDSVARGGRITDGQIVEISLVDRPANKNCGIQLVKAAKDGTAQWVGKVFGADDMIAKAISTGTTESDDVTLTVPADIQMSFTPLDMAKIIARKSNGNGNGFLAKGVGDAVSPVPAVPKADDDEDIEKGKLSSEARNALPDSAFVFPEDRQYPIHDKSHARNALARASGKPEEARVRAAVARRYPGIGKKAAKKAAAMVANEAIPDVTKPVEKTDSDSDDKTKAMCLGCGAKQNSEHAYCTECGKTMTGAPEVSKNHDFACLGCGKDLDKGERFCPSCGKENPGHNPMADLKIPSNKSEGSRVAAETTDTAVKAKKPKGKGKKGKPFGGSQAPPFGSDKDGDGKDDAEKVSDAPLTAIKEDGDDSQKCDTTPPPGRAAEMRGTPVTPRAKRKKNSKPKMPAPSAGQGASPIPGSSMGPADEEFERDTAAKYADPAVGTAMRLKSLGIEQDMGYAHDLTCPAFSWDDVAKSYPAGLDNLDANQWQQKALDAAASAPLAQAQAASRLGQAAFTIKSASLRDLMDVKSDINKAFRDANPGPGSAPTPGHVMAQSFQRPKITAGHAAYSHQYEGPNSAKVPASGIAASQFTHGFLPSGRADDSPANKSGAPYPAETGVPVNLDYSNIQKEQVAQAFMAMHGHFDRVFPGVCPMNQSVLSAPAHQLDAAKADDSADVTKDVTPDGMSKNQRKKLRKKLTKKVMAGKMPLDTARIRMGKKPKKSPEPLNPQKAIEPDMLKAVTKAPTKTGIAKAVAVELRKAQKTADKKISALTKAVNALADQPDPATQAFKGMAVNPIRSKSASPAGVQSVAEVAERTQVMMLHELEAQWRNSTDPAQREAAWNASLKMRGLPDGMTR